MAYKFFFLLFLGCLFLPIALSWGQEGKFTKSIKALGDENPKVRDQVMKILKSSILSSEISVYELFDAVAYTEEEKHLALALKQIGKEAPVIFIPILTSTFAKKEIELDFPEKLAFIVIREKIAFILIDIGKGEPDISIPLLISSLNSEKAAVRGEFAFVLGEIGEKATSAIPTLTKIFLSDEKSYEILSFDSNLLLYYPHLPWGAIFKTISCRKRAAVALAKIGDATVIPYFIAALANKNPEIRQIAAEALGIMGEKAELAIPALLRVVWDKDSNVSQNAAESLAKIGEKAIPYLEKLLGEKKCPDDQHRIQEIMQAIQQK